MTKSRKRVTMLVTVSIPAEYSAADARREVRANVQHQSMHSMDDGDVKLIGVRSFKSQSHNLSHY